MSRLERHTYHCLRCGRLVCRDRDLDHPDEQELPPPTCCGGLPMVRAVCESVRGEESSARRKELAEPHPTASSGAAKSDTGTTSGTTPTGTAP